MKNILEYLENAAAKYPGKTGFTDEQREAAFSEVMNNSKKIACALRNALSEEGIDFGECPKRPVAIMLDRNIKCIEAMFSAGYAGCFYVVIDVDSPASRISAILETLKPEAVITDSSYAHMAETLFSEKPVIDFENAAQCHIDEKFIEDMRRKMIDTDPLYVLFTSGSSGIPKGAVLSHRSVINYINWVSRQFGFSEKTSFGAQTPLYFSMSVTDLYSTVKCAGTYNIIPKTYFTFPMKLIEFINNRKVNTLYWVPSALSILSNWNVFEYEKPKYIEKVLFAGEVMPVKHLNYWRSHLPECTYANLFGPTETTDICTFYIVDREFKDEEILPIGKSCDNCDTFIINEKGLPAEKGEEGELLVRGSFLASGYYNDLNKTKESFIQNPLQSSYPEKVYRTGDLVKLNEKGELIYITRKDFQVKRMGYRIELGEIEAAVNSLDGVKSSAAVYDDSANSILVLYEGKSKNEAYILKQLEDKLPPYMNPDKVLKIKAIPYNANGKIDRVKLKNDYTGKEQ